MAIIGKIRERAGIVIAIIAFSLIMFIVGGDIFGSRGFTSRDERSVGTIAGHDVDGEEFQRQVETIKNNYQQNGQTVNDEMQGSIREQAWNQYILKYAFQREYDKLGLAVTDEELRDMVQGNNISEAVKQVPIFKNQQTGQFDKNLVTDYLVQLKKAAPQNKLVWKDFEENIRQDRLRTKYQNLLGLTTYVTNVEARREYEAQTSKAAVKFLYVPFTSVADSTVKVTDAQLQAYLNKNAARYKSENTRSLAYVSFAILPTKKDSADFLQEIKDLAKGLATAENDTAYAKANSDVDVPQGFTDVSKMSEPLRNTLPTFFKGGVYGPYQEGNTYAIYKLINTQRDSLYSVRASHILIQAAKDAPDSVKTAARKKAEGLLAQARGGANFEELARTNGSDGTASRGGDLGWYTQGGNFIKPFEDALFQASGPGLMPNLVVTEYGYHVVKITEPKTNEKYQFATLKKSIGPSQETTDEVYKNAEQLAAQSTSLASLRENVKKQPGLVLLTAERLKADASTLNSLRNARDIVRWAFEKETSVGDVSKKVFEADNQYVVAAVSSQTDEGTVRVADFRDELTAKVRNELKAAQIIQKLGAPAGKLEDIAKKYGPGALVESASDVSLNSTGLKNVGFEPEAVGKVFGLKKGQRTKPFAGENAVIVLEAEALTSAPDVADYGQYKTQLKQTLSQRAAYYLGEAIKENANIKDNRSRFY